MAEETLAETPVEAERKNDQSVVIDITSFRVQYGARIRAFDLHAMNVPGKVLREAVELPKLLRVGPQNNLRGLTSSIS